MNARCYGHPIRFFTGLVDQGGLIVLLFIEHRREKQVCTPLTPPRNRPRGPTKAWQTSRTYLCLQIWRLPFNQAARSQSCSRSTQVADVDSIDMCCVPHQLQPSPAIPTRRPSNPTRPLICRVYRARSDGGRGSTCMEWSSCFT